MKYIPLILLIVPCIAMKNYIPETKGNSVWVEQGMCEKQSAKKCYPFEAGVDDVEVMLVKDVQVNDLDKPIYAARTNETDCKIYPQDPFEMGVEPEALPADDCRVLTANECTGEFPDMVCAPTLCTDKSYYSLYADKKDFALGDGYFAYCTKLLGYEQKTVKQFIVDATLKAAKDARIAAEIAAKEAKKIADAALKADLKLKKDTWASLSKDDRDAAIKKILDYLFKDE